VISHIGSERPEPGPYNWCWLLTCCTRFGAMRGCQEQNREGDLGGSPGIGWTGRPKADNIQHVRPGCYISTTINLLNQPIITRSHNSGPYIKPHNSTQYIYHTSKINMNIVQTSYHKI